ncbi:hypothetical protein EYF80_030162 [Liparis tanakae]|uniref:Uncharacterized protein n=1 Tax=Liparis tanakae TaxID=230148 RepID=A0A4Z2H2A4_9TELE|nr:hypothetical protein EYF80_030162 [Liparis tanakae]
MARGRRRRRREEAGPRGGERLQDGEPYGRKALHDTHAALSYKSLGDWPTSPPPGLLVSTPPPPPPPPPPLLSSRLSQVARFMTLQTPAPPRQVCRDAIIVRRPPEGKSANDLVAAVKWGVVVVVERAVSFLERSGGGNIKVPIDGGEKKVLRSVYVQAASEEDSPTAARHLFSTSLLLMRCFGP